MSAQMTFDAARSQTVLFGGIVEGDANDTWIFSGPVVSNLTLPAGTTNAPYSDTIPLLGGISPYTFVAPTLPPGITFNTTTGAFGGAPTAPGPYSIPVTIQDSAGDSIAPTLSLTVSNALVLQPTTLPDATTGANYSVQLSATGGVGAYTFSATGLPTGLSINGSNQIVGQCTASSTNVILKVTDSATPTPDQNTVGPISLNCNPAPLITNSSTLANGTVGVNYSVQLTTNAVYDPPGAAPFTWSVPPSSLPPGLGLSATGLISGIPTAGGTTMFTVTFTDRWNATTSQQFQITIVNTLTITTSALAIGTLNIAYPAGQGVTAVGGVPAYNFSGTTGLPPGLAINPTTGAITGTPTQVGSFTPNFKVNDQASQIAQLVIPITVGAAGTYSEDWVQLAPAFAPAAREIASIFYDSLHGRSILFGGITNSGPANDTNAWNGTNWIPLSPAGSPPVRSLAPAAFDVPHGQGVLFGGQDSGGAALGDTWLWNGSTWTQVVPATSPSPRWGAKMAWDGHHIVLFGGTPNFLTDLNDTWIWDGTNWTSISTAVSGTPPAVRENFGFAYDSVQSKVVLFGGYNAASHTSYGDTWIWDGAATTWTQLNPAAPPGARSFFPMVFDASRGQTVLFGGSSNGTPQFYGDTWAFNGTAWTQLNPPHSPSTRLNPAMVFDGVNLRVTLFGGDDIALDTNVGDTWVLDGPVVTNLTLPEATLGVPYSQPIALTSGIPAYLFAAPTLPPGMNFNAASGVFGGTPTAAGPYVIPATIQDGWGVSIAPSFSLTVSGSLSLQPTTLPNATAGTNYLAQLSAGGGVPSYTFSATGLPTGLQLNSGNQIVGQCTASSTNVNLKVTDSATPTANVATVGPLTITCNALPAITTTSPLSDGIVNTPYSANFSVAGGTGPIVWSLTPGTLPSGSALTGNQLTTFSSSPISAQFSITATDFWGAVSTVPFTLNIESVVTITPGLPPGIQGSAYPSGVTLGVSGGTGTYTFSASGLPPGLHIAPSTGAITGTPTGSGIYNPTFTVTDQTPQTVMSSFDMLIASNTGNPNWTNLNPPAAPSARDSYAMAYDPVRGVTVLYGGNAGVADTWTFGFPATWTNLAPAASPQAQLGPAMAWMASQNNMVLFGGKLASTVLNETWVWDGANWTKKSPAHTPPARAYQGMAPDSAHNQVVMFGGSSTGAYQQALGDTWVWTGTDWTPITPTNSPTAAFAPALADGHTGPVLFGGIDASGNALNQTLVWDGGNWVLQHPVISPPARGLAGMVYDSQTGFTILFGGFSGSSELQDTWQWDGTNWTLMDPASVPPTRTTIGLAYDSAFKQIIVFGGQSLNSITDELGDTWTLGFPAITNTTLPSTTAGTAYNATIPVIGGTPPYSFVPVGPPQSLPSGLNLDAVTGKITGSTTAVGTFPVGVVVGDSQTVTAAGPNVLSLTVLPAGTLILSPATLPDATASTNYSEQLSATGGVLPYIFSATGLPAGLQINTSHQIVGQCTAGSTNVTLLVTDSAVPVPSTNAVGPLTVHCNAVPALITTSPLPSGVVGTAYNLPLQISGGTSPIVWTLGTNNLPAGFQLTSTGVLKGTATAPTTAQFSVSVSDFWGATIGKTYTLTFYPVLTITTTSLPNGTAGTPYQTGVTIAASGGTGSGTYAFSATGLPIGYAIDPVTGVIAGNTAQSGPFTPTFTVTDQDAQTFFKPIGLTILSGSGITIQSPTTLPTGATGQLYTYQLQWIGGVTPVSVTSTALPSWLTLNSTNGKLTGTPTTGGAFTFPITVTDSQTPTPNTASQTETIVVNPPSITSPSPLPAAYLGIAYSQSLAAGSGQSPYTWVSSNLPSWLSLSSAGNLTGTPPANAPSSIVFDVTVTDSLGAYNSGSLTLPVLPPTSSLFFQTTSPLPPGTPNVAYSATVQGAGGNGVFTFSASGLPTWLKLDPIKGVLSGTPTSGGPVTFQLTLSDNLNQSLTEYFTLPVNTALTLGTATPLPAATVGLAYSQTLAASGGSGSYTWTATNLPTWLSLSAAGIFSGRPTLTGSVSFRVTLTDSQSHTLGQTYTLPVFSGLTIDTVSPLTPATLNSPYTMTFAASGGGGNYQWSATGLPTGFTLSPAGVLLGTPATGATINFTLSVTDSLKNTVTQSIALPVSVTPTVNPTAFPPAIVGVPYSANITASGGSPGYTFSAIGLPSWLNLTSAGYLSGIPTTAGPVTFQATVVDSQHNSSSGQASVNVNVNPSLSIGTATLPLATATKAYSTTLTAAGGTSPYIWSSTNLPAGLTISAAGVLSGSVAQAGPYPVQATVFDSLTSVASRNYTLLVSTGLPLSFITQSLNSCVPGAACSNQIVAAGGVPPYKFSVSPNTNLNGLSLSANGLLSGTPISGGSISVPVILTDQQSSIAKTFTLQVMNTLVVITTSLPGGTVGVNYGTAVRASGGQPPYGWSLASGSLPGGLTLDVQGGNIYGTPTAAGTFNFSVQAADGTQTSTPQPLSIVIAPPTVVTPLTITSPSQLVAGFVGTAYSQNLSASGGSGQYSWTVTGGTLPAGLSVASSGAITGTPTTSEIAAFTATVNDTSGNSASAGFTILVASSATVSLITPNPLPNGAVGVVYNYPIQVLGGTPPYFFSITSGQVPPGLTFDATNGTLTGTPTQQGSFTILLNVTDSGSPSGANGGSLPTSPAVSGATSGSHSGSPPTSLTASGTTSGSHSGSLPASPTASGTPSGANGGSLTASPTASGATSGSSSGSLPTSLTASGTSASSGGSLPISLTPKQAVATNVTTNYTIQIVGVGGFQIVNPQNLPYGTLGASYSNTFTASGGAAPYKWQLVTGTLPTGMVLSSGGVLTGTPTQSGLTSLVVKATDTKGAIATGAFLLQIVNPNVPFINPYPPLQPGTVGQSYQAAFTGVGGHAPYTWSIASGTLPPGVSLNSQAGTLSGTPTQAGNFPFTAKIADGQQVTTTQAFAMQVNSLTLKITPATIPAGTANVPYSTSLNVAGGTAPYTWSLSAGGLLNGFTIDSASGVVSGTPVTAGSFQFTISVIDSNFGIALQTYQFTVQSVSLSITTTSAPATTVGASYNFALQAANFTPPLTWSLLSGNLPPGIQLGASFNLSGAGLLVGTPTTAGSYTFTIQATDSTGATAKVTLTIVVSAAPLSIVTTSLPGGAVATAYSQTVQSSGGTGAIAWTVVAGTLPTGLSLNSITGTISGTPTTPGSFTFTIQAADTTGATQKQFTVIVAGPPVVPAITLTGLPATSKPGDQPVVTIALASPYPLPITVTATLSITPNLGNSTDLMFANGSRTTQITILASATTATLPFQTGTLPGSIQLSLALSAAGVNITPSVAPSATTVIAAAVPAIGSVSVTTNSSGIQVKVVGVSTTLDMKTATFTFTPATGATLQTSTVTVDVSSLFTAWYQSAASLATGSQFSLTVPFTIAGNASSIASVSVTLTNSVGASAAVSANVP